MKTGTETPAPRNKKKALPLWPLMMMIVVIIIGSFGYRGFNFYTDRLLGELLMEIVQRETDNLYTISYNNVRFNLLTEQLTLNDFSLVLDSSISANPASMASLNRRNLYEAHIPRVEIRANQLWEIYFKRSLKIRGLSVENPQIDVYSFPTEETPATLSFEAGNLYTMISQYLKVFEIAEFNIDQGSFNFHKNAHDSQSNYNIADLSFSLKNFALDSSRVQDSSKVLFVEELMLNVKDQKVYLPDSIHVITFENFVISTEPSEIAFTDIRLQPRSDTANVQPKNNRLHIYDIYLPELKITGVDFAKAYYENTLNIEGITIHHPHFDINERKSASEQVPDSLKSQKNDLKSIVTFFFDKILVDQFNLDSALFELNLQIGSRKQMFAIDNVSMDIRKLNVDTTTAQYRFNDDFNYFEDIDIRVDNYIFQLPDSLHTLRVKEFNLSTENSQIYLDSVSYTTEYTPDDFRNTSEKPGLYNIIVPNLLLTGVDILKVLNEQRVEVGQLNMQKPDIQLFTHSSGEKNIVKPDSLYSILTGILNSIDISNFMLEDGGFSLLETSREGVTSVTFNHINVNTLNLQIDSTTYLYTDELLDADNLNISFANCYFQLPGAKYSLTTNGGYLEGRNIRELHLDNVRLQPLPDYRDERAIWVDLYADTLQLENTNLRQILNENVYLFQRIQLTNPDLKIYQETKKPDRSRTNRTLGKKAPYLLAQQISLFNGNLRFYTDSLLTHTMDSTNAYLTDFEFDANKIGTHENILHLSDIVLSSHNYQYHLPDSIHVLTIDELYSSTPDSTVAIRNFSITPNDSIPIADAHNLMRMHVPSIQMQGHNLYNSFQDGTLSVNKLKAEDAKISLELSPSSGDEQSFQLENFPKALAPIWDATDILELSVENASIDIIQQQDSGKHHFAVEGASFRLNNFHVDSTTQLDNDHFLFAEDFELDFHNYSHALANRPDTMHIGKAIWNKKLLKAEDLFITNSNGTTDTALVSVQYTLSLPTVSLSDLQWYDAYADHRLTGEDLTVNTPQVNIEVYQADKKGEGFSLPRTYPFNPEQVAAVSLKSVNIENAELNLLLQRDTIQLPYSLENASLLLENLYMDSSVTIQPDNLFFTDNIRFQTEDIEIRLADSLQILEVGKVGFVTKDSTLFAKDVKLIPRYGKTEFAEQLGYQKGWAQLETDSLYLKGVHLYDLLHNRKVIGNKLGIDSFMISTYKDKNYPIPEGSEYPTARDFIRNIPFYLRLDTLQLQNGYVHTEILPKEGDEVGTVFFENLNATATDITNDSILIQKGTHLKLDASAHIMGQALLKANFDFDMLHENGNYTYTASLGSMDMRHFNPLIGPIAYVKVRSGKVDTINWRVEANKYYAIGSMDFYYDKLRISILDRTSHGDDPDKDLLSFFANAFIVNTNNPHLFILREGDIYAERDVQKAIFDYWARSSLSGVLSSIGTGRTKKKIKQAQHDALREQIQALKEKQEQKIEE